MWTHTLLLVLWNNLMLACLLTCQEDRFSHEYQCPSNDIHPYMEEIQCTPYLICTRPIQQIKRWHQETNSTHCEQDTQYIIHWLQYWKWIFAIRWHYKRTYTATNTTTQHLIKSCTDEQHYKSSLLSTLFWKRSHTCTYSNSQDEIHATHWKQYRWWPWQRW